MLRIIKYVQKMTTVYYYKQYVFKVSKVNVLVQQNGHHLK